MLKVNHLFSGVSLHFTSFFVASSRLFFVTIKMHSILISIYPISTVNCSLSVLLILFPLTLEIQLIETRTDISAGVQESLI